MAKFLSLTTDLSPVEGVVGFFIKRGSVLPCHCLVNTVICQYQPVETGKESEFKSFR